MKKLGLLLGFLPLVVYGVLAGNSVSSVMIALAAALVVTILTGWGDLRKGMILSWANLALFGGMVVVIGLLGQDRIIPYMGILIYLTLAAVTFGSILVRRPFTLQYARGMVEPALWERPEFIRVNVLMTGVWGGVFTLNLFLTAVVLISPGFIGRIAQVLTYGILAAGIMYTIWYPAHIQKKNQMAGYGVRGKTG